jgi:hypothetical protein
MELPMSNPTSRVNRSETAIAKPLATPAVELEKVHQHVARLTRRIEQQAKHLEGLTDYPELSKRASDVLAQDSEELRLALIQLEDTKRLAEQARNKKNTSIP